MSSSSSGGRVALYEPTASGFGGAQEALARTSNDPPSLLLAGFECSLATTSLERLESLARALSPASVAERFSAVNGSEEAVLLGTCLRRELFVLAKDEAAIRSWQASLPGPKESWRVRLGREAVRHVFRVASGQESLAAGEMEVRHQVRSAAGSTLSRHPHSALRTLLKDAAKAADDVVPTVAPSRSIAALAATRVLELCGRPFPRVLVVGAGTVGRQVAELLSQSARVTMVYRREPPSEEFLRTCGARSVPTEDLFGEIALSDAVVTAAKTGDRCLSAEHFPRDRPLVVVDLGVPRNVDPAVRGLSSVQLVDLGDLGRLAPPESGLRAEEELAERAAAAFDRLQRVALEPWVRELRRTAEEVRTSELEFAGRFLRSLTQEEQIAVDRLTRRLVDRLLRGPTEMLRGVPPGVEGDRLRRFALALFRGSPPAP